MSPYNGKRLRLWGRLWFQILFAACVGLAVAALINWMM